jgi:hypothetical protein
MFVGVALFVYVAVNSLCSLRCYLQLARLDLPKQFPKHPWGDLP